MLRIAVMLLARQTNSIYIHVPFLHIADKHRNTDPLGRLSKPEDWASKWESFLNLGKDEFDIWDLGKVKRKEYLGRSTFIRIQKYLLRKEYFLSKFLKKIRNPNNNLSGEYIFGLRLCGNAQKRQLFLDSEFIQILQKRFNANGYAPSTDIYSDKYLDIAIHIRRGDVWNAYLAGESNISVRTMVLSEEYYVKLIERLQESFKSSKKPVRFHIFSNGQPDDFTKFTFTNEHEADLRLNSSCKIEKIQFHLCQNTFDTLYYMITAPIFVPAKSAFSVLASILNKSYILYEKEVFEYHSFGLLEKYKEEVSRFISLDELEHRVGEVMETL